MAPHPTPAPRHNAANEFKGKAWTTGNRTCSGGVKIDDQKKINRAREGIKLQGRKRESGDQKRKRERNARFSHRPERMRDEARGLEEDGGGDGVIDAELDPEGAFAGEEVWEVRSGEFMIVKVGVRIRVLAVSDGEGERATRR